MTGAHHIGRIGRFGRVYGVIAREAVRHHKTRVIVITLCSLFGAIAGGGVIALLLLLVRRLESGAGTGIASIDERWGSTMPTVVLGAAALLGLQLLSAIATYYAVAQSRALARWYHKESAGRLLSLIDRAQYVPVGDEPLQFSDIRRLLTRCPRIGGVALSALVELLQPVLYAMILIAWLFVISWPATVVMMPILAVFVPILYRFGRHVQSEAGVYYNRRVREMGGAVHRYITLVSHSNVIPGSETQPLGERFASEPAQQAFYDSYDHLKLAAARSTLITTVCRSVIVFALILLLGALAGSERLTWGLVGVYLITFAQAATRVQQIVQRLTTLARYYPLLSSFDAFRTRVAAAPIHASGPASPEPVRLTLLGPRPDGTVNGKRQRVELTAGDRVLLVTDAAVNRFDLERVLAPLERAARNDTQTLGRLRFRSARFPLCADSAALAVFGEPEPGAERRADADAWLAALGITDGGAALADGWQTPLDAETWRRLPRRLRHALQLMALVYQGSGVALIDGELLDGFTAEQVEIILARFGEQIVLVAGDEWLDERRWSGVVVAVIDGQLVGLGDWDWWHAERPRFNLVRAEHAGFGIGDDDEDDDDL